MFAKLRSSNSHQKSSASVGNGVTEANGGTHKGSKPNTTQSPERITKLKKRKSAILVVKEIKEPAAEEEEELVEPSLKKLAAPAKNTDAVRTVNDTQAIPFGAYETEFRLLSDKRTKPTVVPDPNIITPNRDTLPAFDLRRENLVPPSIPLTDKTSSARTSRDKTDENIRPSLDEARRRSSLDLSRPDARKLVKKPSSEESSQDSAKKSMSAIKRRFSYNPTSSPSCAGISSPEQGLSEDEIRRLSITATRIPEFSSAYESKNPSPAIQVTIVDHLPHQKPFPERRLFRRPSTIAESDVNEELLEEQEEVLSYLHNPFYTSPTVASSSTIFSNVNSPQTPQSSNFIPPQRQASISASSARFVGSMMAEFPYLLGGDDPFLPTTQPLRTNSDMHGLGIMTPAASGSSVSSKQYIPPTNFPPSPPQSSGRASFDTQSRAILDELASESRSMKSVVDAINKACTPRSSFDYTDYDDESIYEYDEESMVLPPEQIQPAKPAVPQPEILESDAESIFDFASPILRSGRSSLQGSQLSNELSRSPSQSSKITVFEDDTISEVLAEKRRSKPTLAPLVITPISPGQYGPPLQRRHHLRGKGKLSSPMSARGGFEGIKPTLVKVVEEEIVEYTPIEEGEKGWVRQRRVSRGGDWIVVEREILGQGTI